LQTNVLQRDERDAFISAADGLRRRGTLVVLAAWLGLIIAATGAATLVSGNQALLGAALVGTAIAFGGVYLAYTWVVATGVAERERLDAALKLAGDQLREARELADRLAQGRGR
jgi:hypothetical protein